MLNFCWKMHLPKLVLPVMLLVCSGLAFELGAQTPQIDSLLQQMSGMKEDSQKVILTNKLAEQLFNSGDFERTYAYASEALILAENLNYKSGIVKSNDINRNLGYIFKSKGNYATAINILNNCIVIDQMSENRQGLSGSYILIADTYNNKLESDSAYKYYQEGLKISMELGNSLYIARAYYGMGDIYQYYKDSLKEAQNYYSKALQFYSDVNYKSGIGNTYDAMGTTYRKEQQYTEALNHYLLALKNFEESNHPSKMATTYSNIALIYEAQGNYKSALENQLAAYKHHEEIGARIGWSSMNITAGKLSSIYQGLGEYDNALTYALIALNLNQEFGIPELIFPSYLDLGSIYYAKNEYNNAITQFNEALRICHELGDSSGIAKCYYAIGESNIKLGNYKLAKTYIEDAITIYKRLGMQGEIRDAYFSFANIDSLSGDLKSALIHYKHYVAYQDSLKEATKNQFKALYNQTVAELDVKFEISKREQEIQRLESENEINILNILVKNESIARMQFERDKLNVQSLLQLERIDLLDKEKQLQQLELEKNQCDITAQQAETQKQKDQLTLLNQQSEIKDLRLKRKTQTQYFMLSGFFLFALLGIYTYSNYRIRQNLRLQILRNKIANDLHDDVGSTLSSIAIFSEMAQQQSKETIPLLNTIHESSRNMLDAMADIVWTINPENDHFEKIIMRMRNFAYEFLGAKGIDFQFTADEAAAQIRLPMEVRKNLYLIFKEATNNLVKYSEASRAQYSITSERNEITMMIRDNGKGFDIHSTAMGNGLKSMRKRAEEIGGKLILDSRPGKGTLVMLKIAA